MYPFIIQEKKKNKRTNKPKEKHNTLLDSSLRRINKQDERSRSQSLMFRKQVMDGAAFQTRSVQKLISFCWTHWLDVKTCLSVFKKKKKKGIVMKRTWIYNESLSNKIRSSDPHQFIFTNSSKYSGRICNLKGIYVAKRNILLSFFFFFFLTGESRNVYCTASTLSLSLSVLRHRIYLSIYKCKYILPNLYF